MDVTVDRLRRHAEAAQRRAVEFSRVAEQRPENVAARVRAGQAWKLAEAYWKMFGVAQATSDLLPVRPADSWAPDQLMTKTDAA